MSEPIKKPTGSMPGVQPESYDPKDMPEIMKLAEQTQQSVPPIAGAPMSKPKELDKNVLDGIPHMGYGNPTAVCYIGSVIRLIEYLDGPVEDAEVCALSGVGLCFPWQYNKSCCAEVSIIPEIPQRTFAAFGYESEYYYEPDILPASRLYSKDFYAEKI